MGRHFSLTLLGDATWKSEMLWYHVAWAAPKGTGNGWIEASAITFTSPGNVPGWASFDVLSPPLAAYLASIGDNVDAVVYDVTRQRYYTYRASAQFITGSSMKVPIMLAFLDMTERQGRQADADEMHLLTTMIENSNNDFGVGALLWGNWRRGRSCELPPQNWYYRAEPRPSCLGLESNQPTSHGGSAHRSLPGQNPDGS